MLQILEKKLNGAIFGIKQNTKSATDAQSLLEKMKKINPLIAEDYEKKLASALAMRKPAQA
jgi:hypothetical protein